MQLDVIDDEEPVVEVVGVGDDEALVLAVELSDFGLCRLAAIFADKANLYARPLLRKNLQRDRIRIRVDEYNLRLCAFDQTRDIPSRLPRSSASNTVSIRLSVSICFNSIAPTR